MSQNGWDVAIRLVDGNEQAAPTTDAQRQTLSVLFGAETCPVRYRDEVTKKRLFR